ncbi:hypothetical protein [Paenibacillus sp. HW567]|uniref:hypothetical protein n=1 Tax=Paenibacillus sp. HW567 TaxID=1034769 RepID=UPI00036A0BCC|nr:hypothetical protein [Paenibacillus sp. HW567]
MDHASLNSDLDKRLSSVMDGRKNNKISGYINDCHISAYYHMRLAWMLRSHYQFKICFILCDWALSELIRALYAWEHNEFCAINGLSMLEQLELLHTDSNSGLDIIIFRGTMQSLAELEELPHIQSLKSSDVDKLLFNTEDILCRLSARIFADSTKQYQRVRDMEKRY